MSVNFNHEHVKQHANIDYIRGRVGQSQIKLVTTQTLTGLATWPPVYMKFPATCEGKNYPHKWKKQRGDLSTAGQSIKITFRLSQQFPAVDILKLFSM
jgi:hypothetical protein